MSIHKILVVAAAALLGGCTLWSGGGKSSGKVSVNWHCVSDAGSGTQTCHKRRMQNGRPVDDQIMDTIVIPAGQPVPDVVAASGPHKPPADAGDAVPWNRQPLATINTIEDSGGLEVENLGPAPRQARQTVDLWGRPSTDEGAGANTRQSLSSPAGGNAPGSNDSPGGAAASAPPGYTLQVAAFESDQRCQKFVRQQAAKSLTLEPRHILLDGERWCIVTLGSYPSKGEALAASRAYAGKHSELTFWVRSWAAIDALGESAGPG